MPSLAPQHSQRLKQSAGISDAVIAAREYETATNKTQLASLGYSRGQCIVPAMVIPIFDAHGNRAGDNTCAIDRCCAHLALMGKRAGRMFNAANPRLDDVIRA